MCGLRHKAFTLVELLIVIVVIGILAAMMMFSSTEAATSARATNVINNIQALKRAALEYYADNMDNLNKDPSTYKPNIGNKNNYINDKNGRQVLRYLDNTPQDDKALEAKAKSLYNEGYFFDYGKYSNRPVRWYVGYRIKDARIKAKLAGRAKSLNLLYTFAENDDTYGYDYQDSAEDAYTGATDQNIVYLRIR